MRIGTIADDLTGATDIAGFLANGGLDVVQVMGVPTEALPAAEAAVVSLKSRSLPAAEAVAMSLAALDPLRAAGCRQVYFKYCSTFD
ncbi:MAG: four-carbon acid sugar kinase family protein, partial [Planctomycetes bacterium]|nr:four-carbon acid sugar kinase family protein [Planctomycetota bacterium]